MSDTDGSGYGRNAIVPDEDTLLTHVDFGTPKSDQVGKRSEDTVKFQFKDSTDYYRRSSRSRYRARSADTISSIRSSRL